MGTHRLHPFILIVAASILACSDQGPRSPGSDGETSATGVAGSPGPMLTTPGPFSSNQSIAGGAHGGRTRGEDSCTRITVASCGRGS